MPSNNFVSCETKSVVDTTWDRLVVADNKKLTTKNAAESRQSIAEHWDQQSSFSEVKMRRNTVHYHEPNSDDEECYCEFRDYQSLRRESKLALFGKPVSLVVTKYFFQNHLTNKSFRTTTARFSRLSSNLVIVILQSLHNL